MASSKENRLAQVFLAIGNGAGGARLSEESVSWLFDRYSKWLNEKTSTGETPLEAWQKHGGTFLKQFTRIGQALGAQTPSLVGPAPTSPGGFQGIVLSIEGDSDCPYCPSTPKP